MTPNNIRGAAAKQAPHIESIFGRAAIIYAERFQFSVFPCRPQGKEPLTQHGCKDASLDSGSIDVWWRQWPNANVAIACGAPSGGLLVLDVDGDEGQDSLKGFESTYGVLPRTPQVLTGRGAQFYFRSSQPFKNRVRIAPGIDIRSDGGYVITAPSIHANGKTYAWEVSGRIDEVPIAPVPSWLSTLLTGPGSDGPSRKDWTEIVANGAPCGARNQTLASVAGHLFRRYVDSKLAYVLLWAWNQCCTELPIPKDEFDRTVESIAKSEYQRQQRGKK